MAPVSKRQRLHESSAETRALTHVFRTQATPAESPPTLIALNSLKPFTSEFVGNMSNTAQRAFYYLGWWGCPVCLTLTRGAQRASLQHQPWPSWDQPWTNSDWLMNQTAGWQLKSSGPPPAHPPKASQPWSKTKKQPPQPPPQPERSQQQQPFLRPQHKSPPHG